MKVAVAIIGVLLIFFNSSCKKEDANQGFVHKFSIINDGTSRPTSFPAKQFTYMTIEPSTYTYGGPVECYFVSNPNTSIPVNMSFPALKPSEQPVFFKISLYLSKNGECISWNSVALQHGESTTIYLLADENGYISKSTIGGIIPNQSTVKINQ